MCFQVASSTRFSRAVPKTRGSRESTARARCVRGGDCGYPVVTISRSPALPLSRSSLSSHCKSARSAAVTQKHTQCHYRGTLISGVEFDSSYKRGQPTTFAPNQVVRGWTEAMQLMREGDKWQVRIQLGWLCVKSGGGRVWGGGRAGRGGRERFCVCRWSGSVRSDVPALACVRCACVREPRVLLRCEHAALSPERASLRPKPTRTAHHAR